MLTCFHNRQQQQQHQQGTKRSLCVFPARAGDTKTVNSSKLFFFIWEKELFIYNTVALVIAADRSYVNYYKLTCQVCPAVHTLLLEISSGPTSSLNV